MGQGPRVALAVIAGILTLGFSVWRLVNALTGGSRKVETISLSSGPNPSCADPVNRVSALCADNPCNPASSAYTPNDPSCGSSFTTPSIPTFPIAQPAHPSSGPHPPPHRGPPPPGPVRPSSLSRALDHQLQLYIDVTPDSVSCPALPRRKGTTVTCQVTGKSVQNHMAPVQGTAQVTIDDPSGQTASASFSLHGAGGFFIRGSGYPFDPDTGRVL